MMFDEQPDGNPHGKYRYTKMEQDPFSGKA